MRRASAAAASPSTSRPSRPRRPHSHSSDVRGGPGDARVGVGDLAGGDPQLLAASTGPSTPGPARRGRTVAPGPGCGRSDQSPSAKTTSSSSTPSAARSSATGRTSVPTPSLGVRPVDGGLVGHPARPEPDGLVGLVPGRGGVAALVRGQLGDQRGVGLAQLAHRVGQVALRRPRLRLGARAGRTPPCGGTPRTRGRRGRARSSRGTSARGRRGRPGRPRRAARRPRRRGGGGGRRGPRREPVSGPPARTTTPPGPAGPGGVVRARRSASEDHCWVGIGDVDHGGVGADVMVEAGLTAPVVRLGPRSSCVPRSTSDTRATFAVPSV